MGGKRKLPSLPGIPLIEIPGFPSNDPEIGGVNSPLMIPPGVQRDQASRVNSAVDLGNFA